MSTEPAGFQVVDEAAGVWAHEYAFAGRATANTLIVRGQDGGLVVVSPGCGMSDADFARIDELGNVSALVAPNGFHHLGQVAWQRRYPNARAFAPESAGRRIARKHPELRRFESMERLPELLPADSWIGVPSHMRMSDVAGWVKAKDGFVWYFTDIVVSFRQVPKTPVIGTLMKWTRSAPGLSVFRLAAPFMLKSRKRYKAWLLQELAQRPPVKIVTGHGALIEADEARRLPDIVEQDL